MMHDFDVVVIGTGAAGTTVALACAKAKRRVAIVDKGPYGGTCALRGCDPKKILVGAEEVVHRRRDLADSLRGEIAIEWSNLMRFKRAFTDPFPEEREKSLRDGGVTTFHGTARFTDPATIAVNGDLLRANAIVLATGARPATLGFAGEELVTKSDQFLDLDSLPRSIVFVGGGYISFEFAHLVARCGVQTTILHHGTRPLEHFDADLVSRLIDASRDAGITIELGTQVRGVDLNGSTLTVHTDRSSYPAEMVVHGAGRVPDLDDLDLERGEITRSTKGVAVNAFLQSDSNPRVYAAGDSSDDGGAPLTPVAKLTGEIVAENILHGNRREAELDLIPSLVFTNPILAAVGIGDDGKNADSNVKSADMSTWYSYRRIGERFAAFKVLTHKTEDRVLGAHILGPGSEELINIFTLAIRYRVPVSHLREMVFAYPTYTSDVSSML